MLKEYIDEIIEISSRYDSLKSIQNKLHRLRENYENYKLPIVMVGEFSVGKSSLVNAFLEEPLLEVDTNPTTDHPYVIEYAETNERRMEGKTEIIRLNNEKLKNYEHLRIVDLPGITSVYLDHIQVAKDFLSRDRGIVVLVLDSRKGTVSREVLDFLQWAENFRVEIAVILNKTEFLSGEELKSIMETAIKDITSTGLKPSFVGKTSVVEDDVTDFQKLLDKYEKDFHRIRDMVFMNEWISTAQQLKDFLQRLLETTQADKKVDEERLREAIRLIESRLSDFEDERDRNIAQLHESIMNHFQQLTSELSDYVLSRWQIYASDPDRFEEDVREFLRERDEELAQKISDSIKISVDNMSQFLDSLNKFDELKDFLATTVANRKVHEELPLPANIAKDAIIGLGLTRLAATIFQKLGLSRFAAFFSNPITALGVTLLSIIIGRKQSESKVTKQKEAVWNAIQQVNMKIMERATQISREVSEEVVKNFEEQIRQKKEELLQLQETLMKTQTEKQKEILQLKKDIDSIDMMLKAISRI